MKPIGVVGVLYNSITRVALPERIQAVNVVDLEDLMVDWVALGLAVFSNNSITSIALLEMSQADKLPHLEYLVAEVRSSNVWHFIRQHHWR